MGCGRLSSRTQCVGRPGRGVRPAAGVADLECTDDFEKLNKMLV